MKLLAEGQYATIHPSLSFLKEKCIFGVQTGRNLTKLSGKKCSYSEKVATFWIMFRKSLVVSKKSSNFASRMRYVEDF
jgi:hypothetical protein